MNILIEGKSDSRPVIDKRHLPYKLDEGIGSRARIGIIALPDDQTIEHELRMIFDLPGVACFVNRFEVPVMGSWNEPVDAKVGRISPESIRKAVLDLGRSDLVDTVFISCTNLRALSILKDIELELDKPETLDHRHFPRRASRKESGATFGDNDIFLVNKNISAAKHGARLDR